MNIDEVRQTLRGICLDGPVSVRHVDDGGDNVCVLLNVGDAPPDGSGVRFASRHQNVVISMQRPYLVVRSRVMLAADVDTAQGSRRLWGQRILLNNAGSGLGAVVLDGDFVCVEMALLADHTQAEELALAIQAVGLEADHLEEEMNQGADDN